MLDYNGEGAAPRGGKKEEQPPPHCLTSIQTKRPAAWSATHEHTRHTPHNTLQQGGKVVPDLGQLWEGNPPDSPGACVYYGDKVPRSCLKGVIVRSQSSPPSCPPNMHVCCYPKMSKAAPTRPRHYPYTDPQTPTHAPCQMSVHRTESLPQRLPTHTYTPPNPQNCQPT